MKPESSNRLIHLFWDSLCICSAVRAIAFSSCAAASRARSCASSIAEMKCPATPPSTDRIFVSPAFAVRQLRFWADFPDGATSRVAICNLFVNDYVNVLDDARDPSPASHIQIGLNLGHRSARGLAQSIFAFFVARAEALKSSSRKLTRSGGGHTFAGRRACRSSTGRPYGRSCIVPDQVVLAVREQGASLAITNGSSLLSAM